MGPVDANGNVTQFTPNVGLPTLYLNYDAENRMTGAASVSGYGYDARNKRIYGCSYTVQYPITGWSYGGCAGQQTYYFSMQTITRSSVLMHWPAREVSKASSQAQLVRRALRWAERWMVMRFYPR